MTAVAYPLQWPEGWERTHDWRRRQGPYKVSLEQAIEDLRAALSSKEIGALSGSVVISTNIEPRLGKSVKIVEPKDPGVAAFWSTTAHGQRVMACDRWSSVRANVRAIWAAVEGLRAIERAGASQILERAFSAFGALPPSASAPRARPWWQVLEIPEAAITALSVAMVEARYRELAAKAHPDRGGSDAAMAELNGAREQAARHYGKSG